MGLMDDISVLAVVVTAMNLIVIGVFQYKTIQIIPPIVHVNMVFNIALIFMLIMVKIGKAE